MGKNMRVIILSLAVLVTLGGAILVLQLTKPSELVDEPGDNTELANGEDLESPIVFTDFAVEDVLSVHIINQKDDGYTIKPIVSASADETGFSIAEIDERSGEVPYNREHLLGAAKAAANISARSTVETNAEDLDKYGLLNPTARVSAEFRGGFNIEFLVGDASPDGTTLYFKLENDDTVYSVLAYMLNHFFNERHDWINRLAFPEYNANAAPVIESVTIIRADSDEPIVIEAIPELPLEEIRSFNSHKLTSPFGIEVDPEKSTPVIYGLFGLTAANVLWVAPNEVDYELTGLSAPQCVVEVTAGDEVYRLTIGDDYTSGFYNDGVYGISSHAPDLLFLFAPSSLPWLNVGVLDLVSDVVITPYIYSLEKLLLKTADSHDVELTVEGDEDGDTVFFDGKPLNAEDRERFGILYQFIISARGESLFMEDSPENSSLIASITFVYRDKEREPDTVEYFTGENRRSIIRVNGVNVFTCRDVYTTRLAANIEAFINGGSIINDW
ncbi:MAG: DUF4340 domain-containing protein [Oscillospiraceae bacterium]|nr:DUF4340 domain-containing protein [Oscillospiraceae bacterium]